MTLLPNGEWQDWLPNVKVLQKAILYDDSGKYLLLRRSETKPMARQGKWDICGGAMSVNDYDIQLNPHVESLNREIFEETGFIIDSPQIIFVGTFIKETQSVGKVLTVSLAYKAHVPGNTPIPKLSEEHIEYTWVTKDQAETYDFGQGNIYKDVIDNL